MNPPTKEQLEAVSSLLQACKDLGATFKTGETSWITLPDRRQIDVEEPGCMWLFRCGGRTRRTPKSSSSIQIQAALVNLHLNILQDLC